MISSDANKWNPEAKMKGEWEHVKDDIPATRCPKKHVTIYVKPLGFKTVSIWDLEISYLWPTMAMGAALIQSYKLKWA